MAFRLELVIEEFFEVLCSLSPYMEQWVRRNVFVKSINERIDKLKFDEVDLPNLMKELADLDYVVEGLRLECGVDGEPIHRLVHKSNMSKIPQGMGKATKPPGYVPPDIASELRRQGWTG